jgi:glycosyltransferase involved in cell wall biosynthesis
MATSMNNISICMAVHNGAEFIKSQIDSILPQLTHTDELILSDDASNDTTLDIIRKYNDRRIKLLPSIQFNNPSLNFERTLAHASNELIFLADQDDIWLNNKISIMTSALENCDLCVCDCRIVDKDLNEIAPSFFEINNSQSGLVTNFMRNSFIGCCMAFHKKILLKALPFPKGIPMHDLWIGLVAEKYFKVKFIPQILVDHRRHDNNYSTTAGSSRNSISEKVTSRFMLALHLLSR